jgi:hypothetical protein
VANDLFGNSVAISGDTVIIGAYGQDYDAGGANPLSFAGAAYVFTRSLGVWSQGQKLVGTGTNGRVAGDYFGNSVAISGDTVIIGAGGQDYDAGGANPVSSAGAAYVFTRTLGVWSQEQKLVGTGTNGRVANDLFGNSVAISGDAVIIIGAWGQSYDASGANPVSFAGAAYVYSRVTIAWSQDQKITDTILPASRTDLISAGFGSTIAISEDGLTMVVGAPYDDTDSGGANTIPDAGAAFVYIKSGGVWVLQQKLVGTGTNYRVAGDFFGTSVAISGDTVIIGAFGQDYDAGGANLVTNAGAAYVFTRSLGVWSQEQKLVGTGTNGRVASDLFGTSVAISGDTVIMGAYGQDYDAGAGAANFITNAGAAYVFTRSLGVWSQEQKLVGTGTNGRVANDYFGNSVAISGDTVVIGAYTQSYDAGGANLVSSAGAAYVFTRSLGVWSPEQKLVGTGTNGRVANDYFGIRVAISGNTIIIGAYGQAYDASGANPISNAGAAYVFTRSLGVWSQEQKLVGTGTNGRVAGDSFGASVAISENVAADGYTIGVGAYNQSYTSTGTNPITGAGAVFVFY